MSIVKDLQRANADQATQALAKQAANTGGQQSAASGTPGANDKPAEQPAAAPAANAPASTPGEFNISKWIKEQHGVELSDDEIVKRLKGGEALGPASAQKPAPVDEATDDEIIADLERNGKTRDYYNTASELLKKEDFELVKLHWQDKIRAKNPELKDDEIDSLLKEKYFISDEDGLYQPHEVDFGKESLAAEANRIRTEEGSPLQTSKSNVTKQKKLANQHKTYVAQVDQFISAAPKELTVSIGKRGNNDLGDFKFPILPETQAKVAAIMKDPQMIAKAFSGPDGKIDPQKVYNLFLKAEVSDDLAKSLADHYHGKGVELVSSKLNSNPDVNKNGQGTNTVVQDRKAAEEFNASQINKNVGRR